MSGRPVIAFNQGGALDSVVDKKNGVMFGKQSKISLKKAINKFINEKEQFAPIDIRASVLKFDQKVFERKLLELINVKWTQHQKTMLPKQT